MSRANAVGQPWSVVGLDCGAAGIRKTWKGQCFDRCFRAATAGRTGRARKRQGSERMGVEAADAPLFETLRAWRRERAAEQRVPPYVIDVLKVVRAN